VVYLALGGVLGALGGLFGIGGGLIAIPVLALFFGLNQQHAQGTALVMVVPNVLVGLWDYARRGSVDRRVAISRSAERRACISASGSPIACPSASCSCYSAACSSSRRSRCSRNPESLSRES